MALVNDYNQVKEIYQQVAQKGVALPAFCAEDRETMEAILAAAYELSEELGVADLPVVPAWTARYPGRQQMTLVSASKDPYLGMELMHSDLAVFTGEFSRYNKLRVMPHLDHAFPWIDEDMLVNYADKFASVMCDASERPFDENIKITADYVEKVKGRVVVEGGVDEVFEAEGKGSKNEPSTVEQAERFVSQTGVDIIVPNVGTEHRSTADKVKYNSKRAKEISDRVGKILCIHGASSVAKEDLSSLPDDGFIKINIFTTLVVHAGTGLVDYALRNVGNVFSEDKLKEYIDQGILGKAVLEPDFADTKDGVIKPKLNYVTNPYRRNVWFTIVKDMCKEFMKIFNYSNFAK